MTSKVDKYIELLNETRFELCMGGDGFNASVLQDGELFIETPTSRTYIKKEAALELGQWLIQTYGEKDE